MAYINKYRTVELKEPVGELKLDMGGQYRFVHSKNGIIIRDTGWSDNLITADGLDMFCDSSSMANRCIVGSSLVPPDVDDKWVGNELGTTTATFYQGESWGYLPDPNPNWDGYRIKCWVFAPGVSGTQPIDGTVNEVAVNLNSDNSRIFSHASVVPGIPMQPDETLHVYYRFWYTKPIGDSTLDGYVIDGVAYDTITRGANYVNTNTAIAWPSYIAPYALFNSDWKTYDGVIGTINELPAGNSANWNNAYDVKEPYASGDHYMTFGMNMPLSGGNLALPNGFRSTYVRTNYMGLQTQFTAVDGPNIGGGVPKDDRRVIEGTRWRVGWQRGPGS